MGTGAGNDHLDEWMRWTHERLRARGQVARYEYDDRALGARGNLPRVQGGGA